MSEKNLNAGDRLMWPPLNVYRTCEKNKKI